VLFDAGGYNCIVNATRNEAFKVIYGEVIQVGMSFRPQDLHIFSGPVCTVCAPQQVFFDNVELH